jgi:hypothetical protein
MRRAGHIRIKTGREAGADVAAPTQVHRQSRVARRERGLDRPRVRVERPHRPGRQRGLKDARRHRRVLRVGKHLAMGGEVTFMLRGLFYMENHEWNMQRCMKMTSPPVARSTTAFSSRRG